MVSKAVFLVAHLEAVVWSKHRLCKTPIHSAAEAILPCDDAATRICCVQKLSANLGGGFKYVLFSPLFGEMIQFD